MIPASQVVARAKSAIGKETIYKLGKGGIWPSALIPSNQFNQCDCSGFVAWALGVSRQTANPWYKQFNGGWLETTAIARDALELGLGMFDVANWLAAEPGMLLVWGDQDGHQGHVGVVTEVDATGPIKVVHCSKGNFDHFKDAIQETGVEIFKEHHALVAKCAWVVIGA